MAEFRNLGEVLKHAVLCYAGRPAFGTKINGKYEYISYETYYVKVKQMQAAFKKNGLKKGDRIAIISNNSVNWAVTSSACYGLGLVVVAMYEVQSSSEWEYIVNDSGARWIFVANDRIANTVSELNMPSVERVVVYNNPADSEKGFDSLLTEGDGEIEADDGIEANDLANIIYTSGTTGRPKGVMLTHRNFIVNMMQVVTRFDYTCDDICLSFLPWAHAFGLLAEHLVGIHSGICTAFAESHRTIALNLTEVNPTVLIAVPKIFNKIYDAIMQKNELNPPLARFLFEQTQKTAKKVQKSKNPIDKMKHGILQKVVGEKIRYIFGKNLRFCISGGAALSQEIIEFFFNCGIDIYEGYGMTEHSPIIAVNAHNCTKFGSVGTALPTVKVWIRKLEDSDDDSQGEIMVSGDCVMAGYYNMPEETAEVLENGALHTGDLGYIDEDGYVFITGRVKEQYKLENGKYVVPSFLEKEIQTSPFIENAVIFGSSKPYNVVLIRPNLESLQAYAKENKIGTDLESIRKNPKIRQLMEDELQRTTANLRGYEKPRKFELIFDEFSVENGMLTPALKLRRHEVAKHYADVIDALYQKTFG